MDLTEKILKRIYLIFFFLILNKKGKISWDSHVVILRKMENLKEKMR